ncbi:glutamate racemase [Hafnia paralvei]|jgi:glutamate racemase|uniref:glutamate racemase n=1 Tax=Hafnia paralvei TaxID=546367 RepID=UPI0007E47A13|nr:glutamate racemase [Hafnia paralvei]MDU1191056.1 glutamate racemase [Enterobacteriaceae bacterium]MCE9882387.1 glutamate racemase [Hafnia paralvei]MCE9907891.1 glutamate racemase [Hafnia paralvei]MCE9911767.1 glutamate racemase [Hafnia paralvei]MDU1243588.1 glutamate racemase [Enterobacteriaceae bacterium]
MATKPQVENIISPVVTPSNDVATAKPTALVFDSGVGGLSVYQEIRSLLPDLHYIYAFDNQGFPYGEKDEAFIIERVVKTVAEVQKRHPLSIVIIACNTASTITLPALRERFSFPIVGVVPAIKPAAKLTRNGVVGLLATKATVQRSYTHDLIARFATDCDIKMLGSSELVVLAEAKLHGEVIDHAVLKKILRPWLSMAEPPDTVVLGCTHFPLLREELAAVLPDGTRLVDSGAAIARRVAWLVANQENTLSTEDDVAYATKTNSDTEALLPVLHRMGFSELRELSI